MLPTLDDHLRASGGCLEDSWQRELELLLQVQQNQQVVNRERNLNICRSGSAPPTVDGSLSAVGSLFRNTNFNNFSGGSSSSNNNIPLTEDEIRSHPAYLSYYYSHDNINPRLPPPLLSKEDWRIAQRFQTGGTSFGGTWDLRRKSLVDEGNNSSLFAMQPPLSTQQMGNDLRKAWNVDGSDLVRFSSFEGLDRESNCLNGLGEGGIGLRRKSFADILQKGLNRPASAQGHLPHATSHDSFGDVRVTNSIYDRHPTGSCNALESLEGLYLDASLSKLVRVQSHDSFASAVGSSLSRSTTPEQQLFGRASSSTIPPVGSRFVENQAAFSVTGQNGRFSGVTKLDELAATLSSLSVSDIRYSDHVNNLQRQLQLDLENQQNFLYHMSNGVNKNLQQQLIDKSNRENASFSAIHIDVASKNNAIPKYNASMIRSNMELSIPKRTSSSANLYSKGSSTGLGNLENSDLNHQNLNVPNVDLTSHLPGAYSLNQNMGSLINNHTDAALFNGSIGHNLDGQINLAEVNLHPPTLDASFTRYLQKTLGHEAHDLSSSGVAHAANCFETSYEDFDGIHKAYLELLLAQHKQQQELLSKASSLNQGYLRNSSYGLAMPYPANEVANSALPSVGSGRSFTNGQITSYGSTIRNPTAGSNRSWHADAGNNAEHKCFSSLIDEFKNNKTMSFELSDIINHVVEFSMDQFGSRFIQQKLETATVEEKEKIFPEIIPHACTLMTDVFGNYVIQKFFKHGTERQKMELANQVKGHVLQLSLQMYGCRVIQKALEVVDVDQQTQMVSELDGSVMKCVRDQNGNHVVQKCIECVPEDRIQFIFSSFYGQVVALASHPYGCRVIQRVLEHCNDEKTQEIMGEIMQSVCTLAQDQYGNYVIQHVLEHGKPHERSAIISKLAGEIVKMSQQKFASNVVEKCLIFGGPDERQLLVNEMLGSTDENEPLQAMMKDPFGNYVVQKVLETCNDQNLELLLSRIKIHLNALKSYTYGKHIVSRVEKLIATGERRIGLPSSLTA